MQERNNSKLKFLDFYLGVPLLFGLGLFRRKNKFPDLSDRSREYRVLFIKTAGIGDTVLLSAIAAELKNNFPNIHIDIICAKGNRAMAELLPDVGHVEVFLMNRPVESLAKVRDMGEYDLVFDFAPWAHINAVISYFAKGRYKMGFKRAGQYRHYVYDAAAEHTDDCHELDNYRKLLKLLPINIEGFKPRLDSDNQFDHKKYALKPPAVVFHLYPGGSSAAMRFWAEEKWLELGRRIYEKYKLDIVLTGGAEDRDAAEILAARFITGGVPAVSLAGRMPLGETIDLLAAARLLVTVNTGIMHIGAAAGTELIALHGATNPKRWGPISDKATVVTANLPCQHCISLGSEYKCPEPICMENISVDMVWAEVRKKLAAEI